LASVPQLAAPWSGQEAEQQNPPAQSPPVHCVLAVQAAPAESFATQAAPEQ
jgi:hypothetical protein